MYFVNLYNITDLYFYAVYQPINANYKRKMVELGGLAETLVLSLTLVEDQLAEKLWIIKTLQHLSTSGLYNICIYIYIYLKYSCF